ncbi:MAG TPA: alcohol dehydrogenase catalytic domain-containing protein [Pyrinomonadaceae bacterium]|nr:alcohol dehydrogenase catalytic domain-containing protein [Pyrinomonadaceae bacterium]
MKALRFTGGRLSLDEIDPPFAGSEALIRVVMSGICNTDIEIVRGYAGFSGTIGHEFVGIVEELADRTDLIGKRVVGEINAGCGVCANCVGGDPRHCPSRTVLGIVGRDGAHAEFLRLPAENLVVVPDNVSNEQAVFAEPLAAAWGIREMADIKRDTRLAVIGDGKLGLLCAMSLRLVSDNVISIGKHRSKLDIASAADIETMLVDEITGSLNGSFDVVVEASGSESGFATALDLVRPRGTIVLKSTFHGTPTWNASRVVVNEISVVGSRCGRFAPAVDLLESGRIDVTRLIGGKMPLSDGVSAMGEASKKGALKILLAP